MIDVLLMSLQNILKTLMEAKSIHPHECILRATWNVHLLLDTFFQRETVT